MIPLEGSIAMVTNRYLSVVEIVNPESRSALKSHCLLLKQGFTSLDERMKITRFCSQVLRTVWVEPR
jgi:hypothetical protein